MLDCLQPWRSYPKLKPVEMRCSMWSQSGSWWFQWSPSSQAPTLPGTARSRSRRTRGAASAGARPSAAALLAVVPRTSLEVNAETPHLFNLLSVVWALFSHSPCVKFVFPVVAVLAAQTLVNEACMKSKYWGSKSQKWVSCNEVEFDCTVTKFSGMSVSNFVYCLWVFRL